MRKLVVGLFLIGLISNTLMAIGGNHHGHHKHTYVDLTHEIEEKMPVAKDISPIELGIIYREEGNGLRSEHMDIIMAEKVGTHINAPKTYNQANTSLAVDKIPLEDLIHVPGVVIDLPAASEGEDKAKILSTHKLESWERVHGPIPEGAFVIIRTGWNTFYDSVSKYFGIFEDEEDIMIPGFSLPAVEWLLKERKIVGVGTECFDIELPWKTNQAVKKALAADNKFSIVQLKDVDLLPPRGFDLIISPFKLKDGYGGAVRVFAVVHHDIGSKHDEHHPRHHKGLNKHHAVHTTTPTTSTSTSTSTTTTTTTTKKEEIRMEETPVTTGTSSIFERSSDVMFENEDEEDQASATTIKNSAGILRLSFIPYFILVLCIALNF